MQTVRFPIFDVEIKGPYDTDALAEIGRRTSFVSVPKTTLLGGSTPVVWFRWHFGTESTHVRLHHNIAPFNPVRKVSLKKCVIRTLQHTSKIRYSRVHNKCTIGIRFHALFDRISNCLPVGSRTDFREEASYSEIFWLLVFALRQRVVNVIICHVVQYNAM